MSDINNILKQIQSLSNDVDVFVPSLNKEVKIKQLTVKQCKNMINMPQNILHAQYSFFRKFYNVMKENAEDIASELNIVDRVAIMIALRAKSLSKYQFTDADNKQVTVDLNEIVPLIKNVEYGLIAPTIQTDNYTFTLKIPTLKMEDEFNKYIINTFKLSDSASMEEMANMSQEIFGELAIIELSKYISKLTIKQDDTEVDMETLSPDQRKRIIETIQLEEMQEVIEFNNKVHAVESNYTNYTLGEQIIQLDIGPDFFVFI